MNFITRNDFSGMELSVGDRITQRGDGNYIRGDLTLGANFDDGRGNAVISIGVSGHQPRVLGLVVELLTRRRIFVPILRVTAIEPSAVTLATGNVSLRRFSKRPNEVLVLGEVIETRVRVDDPDLPELAGIDVGSQANHGLPHGAGAHKLPPQAAPNVKGSDPGTTTGASVALLRRGRRPRGRGTRRRGSPIGRCGRTRPGTRCR